MMSQKGFVFSFLYEKQKDMILLKMNRYIYLYTYLTILFYDSKLGDLSRFLDRKKIF